jgi:hypothetical protein
VFVALYWQMRQGNIEGPFRYNELYTNYMIGFFSFILAIDWIMSAVLFSKGLKAARGLESLGGKLDRYFTFSIFRFALIVSGSLVLAVGFYLTENQLFTIIFGANIVVLLLFWPTPSKTCNDLHLKGDEKTLVLYKKDRL